jgi:hypothetical protein
MPDVIPYNRDALSQWQHLFTVQTSLTSTPVGLVPGGFRVDVTYGADSAVTSADPAPLQGAALNGVLVSGYESILVTSQAVAEFDGRITIKFNIPPNGNQPSTHILVGARLIGRADLAHADRLKGDRKAVYEHWKAGFGEGAELPFLLTITLDVASAPIESLERDFPAYKPYLPLGQELLLAPGKVTYGPGRYSPPASVAFHVCKCKWARP